MAFLPTSESSPPPGPRPHPCPPEKGVLGDLARGAHSGTITVAQREWLARGQGTGMWGQKRQGCNQTPLSLPGGFVLAPGVLMARLVLTGTPRSCQQAWV